ncbi:MAG TPA: sulfite exporter TauE/SafE family protein [Stellaceae bacterium]|nr:sulfite exporter TauE/SafE family protein [Stellaceae bacterium]
MTLDTILLIAAASTAIGVAIGSTGIGGVLLVPALTFGAGLPVRTAIAIALWSYLWSGLVAVTLYARRGSIQRVPTLWISIGALPGALLGAKATALVPSYALSALIACLLIGAGANALRPGARETPSPRALGRTVFLALGALTGFGGALLGAGGAVILVPVLIALDQPVLAAIGLGQAVQLPVAGIATLVNLAEDIVDIRLGTIVALALTLGIAAGVPLAHALPQARLRRLVAALMTLAGAAALLRLALNAA